MPLSALTCVRLRLKASRAPLNLPSVPLVISAQGSAPADVQVALVGMLRAPAMHFDFDLPGEFAAQVIDVDAGAAVDLRGEFSRE